MAASKDRPARTPLEGEDTMAPSRREFLQASAAIAGASLLPSGLSGSAKASSPAAAPEDLLANIEHLVVVMFENRSFDNLLGYLYSTPGRAPLNWPSERDRPPAVPPGPGGPPPAFEGLWHFSGSTHRTSCHGSSGCNSHDGDEVVAYPLPMGVWNVPSPDPYEPWEHVKLQVFDRDTPITSSDKPNMAGFLRSYADRLASDKNTTTEASTIMGAYAPDQLPVLSTLAQSFAVFDHWFCAVPSQTYCNRSFFHASTSHGFTTNQPWAKWGTAPGADDDTIFDVLESVGSGTDPQAAAPWGVYFTGDVDPTFYAETDEKTVTDYVGLTGLVHYQVGVKYGPSTYPKKTGNGPQRFWPFDKFFCDIADGTLPRYTFIETLGGALPFPLPVPGAGYDFHPPGDVRNGDEVVRQIYEAIRTSGAKGGHDYTQDTMLLIVFDEHGGTYDHVEPPATTAPDDSPLEDADCKFDRLGVRVPAIAISSYTLPGTIVNTEMHHAAVIKTLLRMNPGPVTYLTERDRPDTVADLGVACNGERAPDSPGTTWPALAGPVVPQCTIVPPGSA